MTENDIQEGKVVYNHKPKEYKVEQRSQEWLDLRLGCLTASQFGKIITPATKKKSGSFDSHIATLVSERIEGVQEEVYVSQAMQHGTDTEPKARKRLEFLTDVEIRECGFVKIEGDDINIGCSPDGFINNNSQHLVEIKCPQPKQQVLNNVHYLNTNKILDMYQPQIQGQLYVCNAEYCMFFSYREGYNPVLVKVYRDDLFIKALHNLLMEANEKINELTFKTQE